jgi:hypothetical protein
MKIQISTVEKLHILRLLSCSALSPVAFPSFPRFQSTDSLGTTTAATHSLRRRIHKLTVIVKRHKTLVVGKVTHLTRGTDFQ